MIIVWSDEAFISYEEIIIQLIKRWNTTITKDFEYKTNTLLDHLKVHKEFCPPTRKFGYRKCVIHKNISLIYRNSQHSIELITFIDNRGNHQF